MLTIFSFLQTQQQEWLFASDKVNAVLAVVLIIFSGFISYLFFTQRRIKQLEDQISNES